MHRRYGVLILLSVLTAGATVYSCVMGFYPYGLPLTLQVIGGHTGLIEPLPGIALPDGLRGGQRLDLSAQPLATRIAIVQRLNPTAPDSTPGRSYAFLVGQGATQRTVVVASKELEKATGAQATAWIGVWLSLINGIITLLAGCRTRGSVAGAGVIDAVPDVGGRWLLYHGGIARRACLGHPDGAAMAPRHDLGRRREFGGGL
jgi:hypothetical protein